MSAVTLEKTKQSVSFKNEQLSCTFLKIDSPNTEKITNEIFDLTHRAPNLLHSLPLIIDCSFDELEDTEHFYNSLSDLPLNIVGIVDNKLFHENKPPWPIINNVKSQKINQLKNLKTMVIDRRVRSGDVVEAFDSHLVIMGGVGSGAEVYATGNIYIFGRLQGKAFAGMNGAHEACITCQELDAELVAIAGVYTVHDANKFSYKSSVKIFLDGGIINYRELR